MKVKIELNAVFERDFTKDVSEAKTRSKDTIFWEYAGSCHTLANAIQMMFSQIADFKGSQIKVEIYDEEERKA